MPSRDATNEIDKRIKKSEVHPRSDRVDRTSTMSNRNASREPKERATLAQFYICLLSLLHKKCRDGESSQTLRFPYSSKNLPSPKKCATVCLGVCIMRR